MYYRMVCPSPNPQGYRWHVWCLPSIVFLIGSGSRKWQHFEAYSLLLDSEVQCSMFIHERNWTCYVHISESIILSIHEGCILIFLFPIGSGLKGTEGQSCRQRCIWWSRFEKKWRCWKEVEMQPLQSGVATCDVYEHACSSHGLGSPLIWMLKQPCSWGEDIFQSWSCSVEVPRTKSSAIGNMKLNNWFFRRSSLNWAK